MTLPINPGPRPSDLPLAKRLIVGFAVTGVFGLIAAASSVVAVYTGTAQQDDVLENQRILTTVCENARLLTRELASAEPAPCPSQKP